MSCFGKLFTSVLNTRLNTYLENNNILGNEQAGFRKGYSTIDHIFVLHSLVNVYQYQKRKLFCAFVDYQKAFDLVDRSSLWSKLIRHGVVGKIFTVIKNMYTHAKSCVSLNNLKSEFFSCDIGVRQGENLSPILFALYLNDFQNFLCTKYDGLIHVNDPLIHEETRVYLKLFTLLYADDTIILAESANELQKAMHALKEYCDKWSLRVNTQKTKIIIFSRGKVRKLPKIYYDNSELDITTDFTYLGSKFNYNNRSQKAQSAQVIQARRALFSLKNKCNDLDLPIDIEIELFDQMITPILLYGSEVWGHEDTSIVENFHMKFCKKTLGVHKYTPNSMVLKELNRKRIAVKIDNRMLNYWLKVATDDDSKLTKTMYHLLMNMHERTTYKSLWLQKIQNLLNDTGMSYIWRLDPYSIDKNWFKHIMKIKLNDISTQNNNSELQQNGQCCTYKLLQYEENVLPAYLKKLDKKNRQPITRIKCLNNKLPIITGRQQNIPKHDRLCTLCTRQTLGDEYHYILECPYFHENRTRLLDRHYYNRPSMDKLKQLLNSHDPGILTNLSKLCSIIISKFI